MDGRGFPRAGRAAPQKTPSISPLLLGLTQYCQVDEGIRVRIDPVENSVVASLGNINCQESNTRKVKFQYDPF